MPRRKERLKQATMFPGIGVPKPAGEDGGVMLAEFDGQPIRTLMINDEMWWVAADVCAVLAISNVAQTVRGQDRIADDGQPYRSGGLDVDEWGVHSVYTPSGPQQMLVVNEFGLYGLVLKSRTPKANQFKRWLKHEVIPSIRKTGRYVAKGGKLPRVARRLRTRDPMVVDTRLRQLGVNKALNGRMASEGQGPRDLAAFHDTGHVIFCGGRARELRAKLGLKAHETPLDRMGSLPLASNLHAKILADRVIRERAADRGFPLSPDEQQAIYASIAAAHRDHDFDRVGPGARIDVVDDAHRGLVLDVVRALPSPN